MNPVGVNPEVGVIALPKVAVALPVAGAIAATWRAIVAVAFPLVAPVAVTV